jgi:DNA-directed RNA polymerase specialized sigma24 family protein
VTVADADLAAFYRAEIPAVVRHLVNQGASGQEAADAAQGAFAQAYQGWETIRYPRAWVRTVLLQSQELKQALAPYCVGGPWG